MEFFEYQNIIVIYENKFSQSNYRSRLIYAFRVDVSRVNGKHFSQMRKLNLMRMPDFPGNNNNL